MKQFALLAPALLLLAGCGLQPMYAGGSSGVVASELAAIDVPAIEGQAGWLVRNALIDRLGAGGQAAARYRLDVRLDDKLEGLGVLSDDTTGRESVVAQELFSVGYYIYTIDGPCVTVDF